MWTVDWERGPAWTGGAVGQRDLGRRGSSVSPGLRPWAVWSCFLWGEGGGDALRGRPLATWLDGREGVWTRRPSLTGFQAAALPPACRGTRIPVSPVTEHALLLGSCRHSEKQAPFCPQGNPVIHLVFRPPASRTILPTSSLGRAPAARPSCDGGTPSGIPGSAAAGVRRGFPSWALSAGCLSASCAQAPPPGGTTAPPSLSLARPPPTSHPPQGEVPSPP